MSEQKDFIMGLYKVNGLSFHLTSDNHCPIEDSMERAAEDFAEKLIRGKKAELLILLGDHFESETAKGELIEVYPAVNNLLERVSPHFEQVIFVPGNHDLRRGEPTEDPWKDLEAPPNTVLPQGASPEIIEINGVRILVGNLLYDMCFIPNPKLAGFDMEEAVKFFEEENPDGKWLLRGRESIDTFAKMSHNLATSLQPDIDMVATHTLPHPSLVNFRVTQIDEQMQKFSEEAGVPFLVNPDDDARWAKRYEITPDELRQYWNLRNLTVMGSNLLDHPLANPKEGLTVLYGHNHRGKEECKRIRGKMMRLITHQRYWNDYISKP